MAMMSPMANHMRLPVMKLPGIRFMPCPANTPPRIRAITPTVIRAIRPVRLVTSVNLPRPTLRYTALRDETDQSGGFVSVVGVRRSQTAEDRTHGSQPGETCPAVPTTKRIRSLAAMVEIQECR